MSRREHQEDLDVVLRAVAEAIQREGISLARLAARTKRPTPALRHIVGGRYDYIRVSDLYEVCEALGLRMTVTATRVEKKS